jgi:chromosome segregation ATPase
MKSFAILFILVLTIIWAPAVNAEVYTWVDENGVRHYGDSPPEDAEDAKAVFPEYQYDESQDQQRTEQDQQELNSLIREIDSENARDQAEAQKKAQEAENNREPDQQELIAAEKERLEKKIAFLEQQPLEHFGSQKNKTVRIGYYRYQLQDLMENPEKYFSQPASFEGNVKSPEAGDTSDASGATEN